MLNFYYEVTTVPKIPLRSLVIIINFVIVYDEFIKYFLYIIYCFIYRVKMCLNLIHHVKKRFLILLLNFEYLIIFYTVQSVWDLRTRAILGYKKVFFS